MHRAFEERRYLIPFRATLLPQIFTEVLVIGEGVAGQSAALAAAAHADVIIAAKGRLPDSNTYWAQGGIASVLDPADTFESHAEDTMKAGAGLCDAGIVRRIVDAGPDCISDLSGYGVPFDPAPDDGTGAPPGHALGREGGHTRSRIVHCDGDATGKALGTTMDQQVRAHERIRLFEECFVMDLITVNGAPPRCAGAITHHPRYGLQVIWASATILASGGIGQVYRESTNPSAATGDGIAMAYRAQARIADMAFVQFHPTTLYVAGASRALITEAVRGEGAHLVDRNGDRFMADYHEMAELAPRDIVSRAILAQMSQTGHTHCFLDCRHLGADHFKARFPGISRLLAEFDLDPATDPIPIHPSAHYMIGGVRTDEHARTNVTGLYACGEVACSGLHGANRLASNSLLEGMVMGAEAGRTSAEMTEAGNGAAPARTISDIPVSSRSQLDVSDVRSSLRSVMWRHVGIERTGDRLAEVQEMFEFWARYTLDKIFDDREGWQVQNMLLVGALITRAAQWRCESRGTHYRTDHPEPREQYRAHEVWQRGREEPETESVESSV
ncbi:MAG: L-aspartate oxidase [Phycisphaeraceae bacterium]|nr:L-aspartate oxidase [Phycisphaeraceae bacterium]